MEDSFPRRDCPESPYLTCQLPGLGKDLIQIYSYGGGDIKSQNPKLALFTEKAC